MKIGVIGLIEAGNLGDDLIVLSLLHHIALIDESVEVSVLSFGERINFDELSFVINPQLKITRVASDRGSRWGLFAGRAFSDCDLIILGGGGLIQDVHHPLRPYHWLRWIPGKPRGRVFGLGLGLGPLSANGQRMIQSSGVAFDGIFVRDSSSLKLGHAIGWNSIVVEDLVNERFLDALLGSFKPDSSQRSTKLGVAVRSWPGLTAPFLANHIENVAELVGAESVEFFVLEAKRGAGPDVDFANEVVSQLGLRCGVSVYGCVSLTEFITGMRSCSAAVSMKLHSSVIWTHFDVDVFPIVYSPKVASFFGLPYTGLEILETPVPPRSGSGWGEIDFLSKLSAMMETDSSASRARGVYWVQRPYYESLMAVDRIRRIAVKALERWHGFLRN